VPQPEKEATPAAAAETVTRSPLAEAPPAVATPDAEPSVAQDAQHQASASEGVAGPTAPAVANDESGALPEAQGKHGLTSIDVTIVNSGRVSRALVDGVFKGTPEGSCLARAVRGAHFPRFSQPSLRVSYPLSL
jgi:hypothetical protein